MRIEVPDYVDPAVLKPGATVYAVLGSERMALTVIKMEPALLCRAPDGTVVTLFAHEVVPATENKTGREP